MTKLRLLSAILITLLIGCDDSGPARGPLAPDQGADALVDAEAPLPDAEAIQDAAPPEVDAAPPQIGWISQSLRPRRSFYLLTDTPAVEASVQDIYGDPIAGLALEYTVAPAEVATVDEFGQLTLVGVGRATVTSCHGDLCTSAPFIVDDGPPQLTVVTPTRAQVFVGAAQRSVTVSGTVSDQTPGVRVTVNGQAAEVQEDGTFSLEHEAQFGMNQLRVVADDGLSRDTPEDLRDFLWAAQYYTSEADRIAIENVAAFRMDQALFDGGEPVAIPDVAAMLDVDSLAQLLEVIFGLVDIQGLLNDDDLFGEQGGGFSISGADLGRPTIDFLITPEGLELFVRFGDVQIFTEGQLDLQGQSVDLTGNIDLSIVARIDVVIGLEDRVTVEVGESAVVVESIDADFAAAGLGALINAASSGITGVIEGAFTQVVDDVLRAQISDFIRSALLGIFGDLRSVPVQIDPMLPGVTPVDLTLSLTVAAIEMTQRNWLRFRMDLAVIHTTPPMVRDDDPGVPVLEASAWSDLGGGGIGISLRLSLFNSLLHEVWRGGVLTLEAPLPEELAGLIERVTVDAKLAPLIVPAQGSAQQPLEMQLGELLVSAYPPGSELADTYVVSLRSGMNVQFVDNSFQLALDAVPEVHSQLLEAQSENPLPKGIIESALRGLIWGQLRDALTGGFDLGFSAIDIDPSTLAEFAPRLDALAAVPTFNENLELREGQLRLEGNLGVQLGLSAADEDAMPMEQPGEAMREREEGR